ncbi:hypothetical protein COV93_07975 [Candidatus Woesearchaeota archaeon CG11_big_fil_rev_8_21_14_0_20_43_8]|nr:MAG: hypothetical protein COV93_07975 [Candidatus Woesearchaeota archaeon CG11_big_fil_rev_8_21_14_0_20_43_8]PIO05533.1 MAG: hypothetical protein COT47_04485 [Candidatus Woesearchaeota archaeon CG08_land_8_20_14_0_20_43_7]
MKIKIPFMFLPLRRTAQATHRISFIGGWLERFFPGLRYDLAEADIHVDQDSYLCAAALNSFVVFLAMSGLFIPLIMLRKDNLLDAAVLGMVLGSAMAFFIFVLVCRYPSIMAGKKAEQVDKNLVFALKDLLLQIRSGISLYNAMITISSRGYGLASEEFVKTVRSIRVGTPMETALEDMAIRSKSEYLRKTIWQLVSVLKAGASLEGALQSIINELTQDQRTRIASYSRELNLWSLVYMLFAVAIPTIGSTMMIILSSFVGLGITPGMFIGFLVLTLLIQYALIGFIKARRPIANM